MISMDVICLSQSGNSRVDPRFKLGLCCATRPCLSLRCLVFPWGDLFVFPLKSSVMMMMDHLSQENGGEGEREANAPRLDVPFPSSLRRPRAKTEPPARRASSFCETINNDHRDKETTGVILEQRGFHGTGRIRCPPLEYATWTAAT